MTDCEVVVMEMLESFAAAFESFVWGLPMVALLLGGGAFFLIFSRAIPYRYLGTPLV